MAQERKNLLVEKRVAFDASLTDAETITIEQSRNLMQYSVKGKEAKSALTEEQKNGLRAKKQMQIFS